MAELGSGKGRTEPAIRCPEETDTNSYVLVFHSNSFGD